MALFDSIISGASEKFGLGDKAGTMLSALLALMTNQETGGFSGFLGRFKEAGLGDVATSWVTSGDNAEISDEQIESAIGEDTINTIAEQVGVDKEKATSALAFMTPKVVDNLTPDGEVPDNDSLLATIGGFLSGIGGAAAGAVGTASAMAGNAAESIGDSAEAVGDKVGDAFSSVGGGFDGDDDGDSGSILKWLFPLILLAIMMAIGFMFCSNGNTGTVDHSDKNSNKAESTKDGETDNTNTADKTDNSNTAESNSNVNNADGAENKDRELTEVTLADGTKLQAYPGGIEDQLLKFIGSDEYKNATDADLKNKWFDFDDLNFVFGKTELVPESQRQLDNIVAILKANPDVKIKIGGYTDKTGDDAANKTLSDKRAKAVQAALAKAGVGSQVPEAEGYGEELAKVDESASDEERASDRKTSVRLLKAEAKPAEDADKKE